MHSPTGIAQKIRSELEPCHGFHLSCYRPQRSWGKVMFLQVCVILFTGGVPDQVLPPGTRYTPQDQVPPQPGTPPGTRYPPGPGTPPWARHTHTPQTRYTPHDQVHPPGSGTPPGPGTPPWDQVNPPGTRYPPGTREIRSTRGRYASYWNAVLFYWNYNGQIQNIKTFLAIILLKQILATLHIHILLPTCPQETCFCFLDYHFTLCAFSLNDFVYNTFISCHEYKNLEVCVSYLSRLWTSQMHWSSQCTVHPAQVPILVASMSPTFCTA